MKHIWRQSKPQTQANNPAPVKCRWNPLVPCCRRLRQPPACPLPQPTKLILLVEALSLQVRSLSVLSSAVLPLLVRRRRVMIDCMEAREGMSYRLLVPYTPQLLIKPSSNTTNPFSPSSLPFSGSATMVESYLTVTFTRFVVACLGHMIFLY